MDLFQVGIISGKVLLITNVLSIVLVNVWSFIYHRERMSRTMILFMLLLLGTLSVELYSGYLANHGISNLHLTHFYTAGFFLLLSIIYYDLLKRFQLVVPIGVMLVSGIMIYQLIDSQIVFEQFNTSGFIIAACVMMTYAFFYYIEHITTKEFWDTYNVGLFLYLGGSSVIFLTLNNAKDLGDSYMPVWTINAWLFVLYQFFISITTYRFYRFQRQENGNSPL